MSSDPEILFDRRGAAGLVTLNRPTALNAVSLTMIRALAARLEAWVSDDAVTRVIVTGAGGKAYSAGGDLRALYEFIIAERFDDALTYWREEYTLNALIKRYRKPFIALIDGIVMGGGVGLSVHGSHRVAGDRFRFAMPEVGIGFFPDVGATWFLPRMPGEMGTYCALTGERLDPADGVAGGIATHRVPSRRFPDLIEGLCGTVPVDAILAAFAEPAGDGPISARRAAVDRLFSGVTVENVLSKLDAEANGHGPDAEFADHCAQVIRGKSPTGLKIALAQVRRGANLSFEECMRTEFRIVSRVVRGHDVREGIRAVIIDKDQRPLWSPADLAVVTDGEVARHFAPVERELELP